MVAEASRDRLEQFGVKKIGRGIREFVEGRESPGKEMAKWKKGGGRFSVRNIAGEKKDSLMRVIRGNLKRDWKKKGRMFEIAKELGELEKSLGN